MGGSSGDRRGNTRLAAYRRRHGLDRGWAFRPRHGLLPRMGLAILGLTGALVLAMVPLGRVATSGATIGVVQSFGTANSTPTATLSVSPAAATVPGHLLVATIKDRDTAGIESVVAVTDSAGNTWTPANRFTQGGQADEEIWYAAAAASIDTSGVITVAVSGPAALAVTVLELTGANSTPLDSATSAGASSTAASTGVVTTPDSASQIVIADVGWNADVQPSAQTAGFTTTAVQQSTATGSMTGEQAAWEVTGGAGTQSYGANLSAAVVWTATVATFDAAGTPPPTPTPTQIHAHSHAHAHAHAHPDPDPDSHRHSHPDRHPHTAARRCARARDHGGEQGICRHPRRLRQRPLPVLARVPVRQLHRLVRYHAPVSAQLPRLHQRRHPGLRVGRVSRSVHGHFPRRPADRRRDSLDGVHGINAIAVRHTGIEWSLCQTAQPLRLLQRRAQQCLHQPRCSVRRWLVAGVRPHACGRALIRVDHTEPQRRHARRHL